MAAFQGLGRGVQTGSIRGNQDLLGQYSQAGMFDPFGSPRLRAMRRKRYLGINDAMRRRMSTRGRLLGLDSQSARQAMIDSELQGNELLAGGLQQAEFEDAQGNQDFGRSLYTGELDYQRQRQLQREAAKQQSQGGWGQALGSLVGYGASFLPVPKPR